LAVKRSDVGTSALQSSQGFSRFLNHLLNSQCFAVHIGVDKVTASFGRRVQHHHVGTCRQTESSVDLILSHAFGQQRGQWCQHG